MLRAVIRSRLRRIRAKFRSDPRLPAVLGSVVALSAIAVLGGLIAPPALPAFLLATTAFNLVIGATEARWRLYGWREPGADEQIAWFDPVQPGAEKLSSDLIVPLRDEAIVIGETLRGLLRQTHSRLHIVVSLCDDDHPTID